MSLEEEIVNHSWIFQDALKRAKSEALAQGFAEGRAEANAQVEEARRILRLALAARFPGLENMPEIDHIGPLALLEHLVLHALQSQDQDSLVKAILANSKA